jgi:hypothetical protein
MGQSAILVEHVEQPNPVTPHGAFREGQEIEEQGFGIRGRAQRKAGGSFTPRGSRRPATGRMDLVMIRAEHLQNENAFELGGMRCTAYC